MNAPLESLRANAARGGSPGRILAALVRHAAATPTAPAIEGETETLDYATLAVRVAALATRLRALRPTVVALLADNGPAWAEADLACLVAGLPLVPLPTFFSGAQISHALQQAGVDLVLTDRPEPLRELAAGAPEPLPGGLTALPLDYAPPLLPPGTAKVTFTSGTTGAPKGVCLSQEAMETVAESLATASAAAPGDRHLALLPLATLLENIGGLYAPLIAGACTRLLPGARVGLTGSSAIDPGALLAALTESRATTAILVPQLLLALVAAVGTGTPPPPALRYLAVGGAPVSPRLLALAAALGLPVFEGYGLSECCSVVAVNRPGDKLPGSVGRPLPHVSLRIAEDGGIHVRGAGFLGYLGEPSSPSPWVDTGDLGRLDTDGRLHLTGRRKNMFITAYGRNVAPEWVERELLMQPSIAQAVVLGEGRPFNVAVVVPRRGATGPAVDAALAAANRTLPDYARVTAWLRADAPFTPANGQLTANGRPRRDAIAAAHAGRIEDLYRQHQGTTANGLLC